MNVAPTGTLQQIQLWTDGAHWFTRRLGFGWVAVLGGGRCVREERGPVRDDGTRNFASEAWAILKALEWAYSAGYREAEVRTDFVSMAQHMKRRCRHEDWHAVRLYDWLQAHPEMRVDVRKADGSSPWHLRAHDLAREGAELVPIPGTAAVWGRGRTAA